MLDLVNNPVVLPRSGVNAVELCLGLEFLDSVRARILLKA